MAGSAKSRACRSASPAPPRNSPRSAGAPTAMHPPTSACQPSPVQVLADYTAGRTLSGYKSRMSEFREHIEADRHYYSVPYQLAGQKVDVRLSAATIEI